MKKTIHASICTVLTSGALLLAGTGIAAADVNEGTNKPEISVSSENQEQVEAIARDLELIFTKYIPQVNGKCTVNEAGIRADGYGDQIQVFYTLANNLNMMATPGISSPLLSHFEHNKVTTSSAGSYAKCAVVSGLGIPATAFTAATWATITTAISAWNWGLAASTVVKALGPAFVTSFGKALGGPVLVASALAVAAVACAFA